MPNFTPGPWQRLSSGSVWSENNQIVHMDDIHPTPMNDEYLAEREANARLIAAAPAMYEALHRAVNEMEFWSKGHSDAEIAIARAALAQAEGKL